jgi:cobalt-zinc-cadmium efflux system outer membrane protein
MAEFFKKVRFMKNSLVILFGIAFSLASLGEMNSIKKMSLSDLIERARSSNYDYRAAELNAESKEHLIGPKSSYEDPELSFEMQNYPKDSLSSNEYSMTGNQISLSQKIPFPGKLSKLGEVASKEAESMRQMVKYKELELIRDVKNAYFALLLSYKKKEILTEEKNVLRQVVNSTRQRFTAGKSSQAELLNVQVEEANLLDELLKADSQIKEKNGDLDHLLSESHHTMIEPEDLPKTSFDFKKITEEVVSEKALAISPMIRSKRAESEASSAQLSYAEKGYIPDLALGLGYTLRRPSAGDRGVDFLTGKIGFTLPIWAGTKQSEEIKSALADNSRSKFLLEEEKSHLLHSVHTLYSEVEEASQRLNLYDGGLLPLTRQAVASGLSAYQANRVAFSTLLNSIKIRFQTEFNRTEAFVNYETKIATLEALVGEPLGGQIK